MTLVLFIPHSQGWILFADKQDSYRDGTATEIIKLFSLSANGPAIGCSGESTVLRMFYSNLAEKAINADQDVREQIKERMEKILADVQRSARYSQYSTDTGLEGLLVEYRAGHVNLFKLETLLFYQLDVTKLVAIPKIPEVQPYLTIKSAEFNEKKAIILGEEILRQAALVNHLVGSPEYHGYDLLKITKEGQFSLVSEKPSLQFMNTDELLTRVNKKAEEQVEQI